MPPLVSIMMPCYNSADSLPLALASLFSQTYKNWECILVDDGSTDNPLAVIDKFPDKRILFHRFETNRGRGAARQYALEKAKGEYLCMLDADDWIYPSKIERQVEFMESHPDLAILSTGMAIVNGDNDIVGTRGFQFNSNNYTLYNPMQIPASPIISFAPSIMRSSLVKNVKFDTTFKIAEDKDFLLRILLDNQYAILHDTLYVYTEIESITLSKITRSLMNNRQMYLKYFSSYPLPTTKNYLLSLIKELIYRIMFISGFKSYLIDRRSSSPTPKQIQEFDVARQLVMDKHHEVFQPLAR